MHQSGLRWASRLGVALAVVAAMPSTVRAEEAPYEIAAGSRDGRLAAWRASRLAPWAGIDPTSVTLCPVRRSTPLGLCLQVVRVPMAFDAPPSLLDVRRFQAEHNASDLLVREMRELDRARFAGTRVKMFYGIAGEPENQFLLKRELLIFAAKLSADSRIMRAAVNFGPTSSVRQLTEAEALKQASERATFVQIEEFIGPSPLSTTVLQQLRFASIGAALFTVGAGTHAPVSRAMGAYSDNLAVHPQLWPPGLVVRGVFTVP